MEDGITEHGLDWGWGMVFRCMAGKLMGGGVVLGLLLFCLQCLMLWMLLGVVLRDADLVGEGLSEEDHPILSRPLLLDGV